MAIRHRNLWLTLAEDDIDYRINITMASNRIKHGEFSSWHELWAVLYEEFDELWESIKKNDIDPEELLQIIAVAKAGLLQICNDARKEMENYTTK